MSEPTEGTTAGGCPLCGNEKRFRKKQVAVYGVEVCQRCSNQLSNQRAIAFIIDMILFRVLVVGAAFAAGLALGASGSAVTEAQAETVGVWVALAWLVVLFLSRDAIRGRSIGKLVTGLVTIDERTGAPIGFRQSVFRNWPILIPIVPLLIGTQVGRGSRFGDSLAKSRTIPVRYRNSSVFLPAEAVGEIFS